MINYQNIVKYLSENKGNWKNLLFQFEEAIIEARDNREIRLPVYLTKRRQKSADSVYIKTKRKPNIKKFDQIYDYAGLRILCLFPQDIYPAHLFSELFTWQTTPLRDYILVTGGSFFSIFSIILAIPLL